IAVRADPSPSCNGDGSNPVPPPSESGTDNARRVIQPGVYFRVSLGGATGHKTFARDLGVLVHPNEVLKVTVALIRVYITHGNRADRKKARLKHLLDKWSLERYLEETEKLLGYQ